MTKTLQIEFLDYWHSGGGRSAGSHLDAVVEKDSRGLPFVPGRQLKGLLREAVEALQSWGHFSTGTADAIFGRASGEGHLSEQGSIAFGDAGLPAPDADWLAQADSTSSKAREALYREVFATAIDAESGTAKDKSLRGIEVTIPLILEAAIDVVPGRTPPDNWENVLEMACGLVRSVGAHRSRGLGRARLAWKNVEATR